MDITLYKNNSPNYFINKVLAGASTFSGTLREESSVIDPVIMIEAANLSQYNYLYISSFGRFYYINNIESVRNNLWRLTCHVDVLNTYRSEILAHQAIVSKATQQNVSDLMIDDGEWVVENKKVNTVISFPSGLNDSGEYILITAGA